MNQVSFASEHGDSKVEDIFGPNHRRPFTLRIKRVSAKNRKPRRVKKRRRSELEQGENQYQRKNFVEDLSKVSDQREQMQAPMIIFNPETAPDAQQGQEGLSPLAPSHQINSRKMPQPSASTHVPYSYWLPSNESAISATSSPTPEYSELSLDCDISEVRNMEISSPLPFVIEQVEYLPDAPVGTGAATPETPADALGTLGDEEVKPDLLIYNRPPESKGSVHEAQLNTTRECQPEVMRLKKNCPYCKKRFSTQSALLKHKKLHAAFCKRCKRIFRPASSKYCPKCVGALDPAKWTPESSNCFVCLKACRSEKHLKKHLEIRHPAKKRYRCTDCFFFLKNSSATAFYEGHFRTHVYLQERPIRCLHCRHSFKDLQDRQRHVRHVHKAATEATNVPSSASAEVRASIPARMLFVGKMIRRSLNFNNIAARFKEDY